MGKISPVSGKYIIRATIDIDGIAEKPDVIGAIFGQTEGLLGSDLELRELQRSGRIGRIEVDTKITSGKVHGDITIPSSLDKAETAIIAASMEVIERIGPCNAHIKVQNIEDIRISKRQHVIDRAKELLQGLMNDNMSDSLEISEEVSASVRQMEAVTYGADKLPCGPAVADAEEVIVVEGRADVMTLLKYGFKNAIAMNGSNVPQTIIDMSKSKSVIVFVDGDRGGVLNVKELLAVAEIDFICVAPDGKEVEELTQKEIHKALRAQLTPEQYKAEQAGKSVQKNDNFKRPDNRNTSRPDNRNNSRPDNRNNSRPDNRNDRRPDRRDDRRNDRPEPKTFDRAPRKKELTDSEKGVYKTSIEELLGTKGACLMDEGNNMLGKVPIKELESTLDSLKGSVHAVAIDGEVTQDIANYCDEARVRVVVGMKIGKDVKSKSTVVSSDQL